MPTAVEEMIRWSTPVKEFMRTATADTTVRGVDIAKGESVYLAYVSGNRDEEVFTDPFRFDVGRDPNKHVAFGYGVHFCLGAALARMEMSSLFSELIPRLESIELAGAPELSPPRSSAGSSTFRFGTRCGEPSGSGSFAKAFRKPSTAATRHRPIVEVGEGAEPAECQRPDQQRERHVGGPLFELGGGLRASKSRRTARSTAERCVRAASASRRCSPSGMTRSGIAPMSGPSDSHAIAVRMLGASAIDSAHATTIAVSRSRREPSSGGIGGGGIRLMNEAAKRSLALGKCRYKVARATLALRVTASMVTALGRRNAAAPSPRRATGPANAPAAGRCPVMLYLLPACRTRLLVSHETVSLENISRQGARRTWSTLSSRPTRISIRPALLSKRARVWLLVVACLGVLAGHLVDGGAELRAPDIAVETSATQSQLTWIVDGYTLALACMLLPAGAIGDRYGRRGALLVGLAIFTLASLASTSSSTAPATDHRPRRGRRRARRSSCRPRCRS